MDAETIYQNSIHKMMDAEKIYAGVATLSNSTRSELTQKSQVVFAALVYVHCLLEALHPLAPVASRCHFVDSSQDWRRLPDCQHLSVCILLLLLNIAGIPVKRFIWLRSKIQGFMNDANRMCRRPERRCTPNLRSPRAL